jgi:peroxiredoxin
MIIKGGRVLAIACAIAILGFGPLPGARVMAQGVSCSASITPDTIEPGSNVTFQIQIDNNGTNDIQWIDFGLPSSKFAYTGNSIPNNWTTADHPGGTTVTGATIGSGGNDIFQISAQASVQLADYENWHIQVSDDPGGSNPQTCGGLTGTSIAGHMPQDAAVSVSDVMVSDITSSSAAITWSSDMSTSAIVYFGKTSNYGAASTYDPTLASQHTIVLTGLKDNTTYHFQVAGDDGSGGIAYSMDNTFITSQAPVVSGGGNVGGTKPSGVVVGNNGDTVAPQVGSITKLNSVYATPPTITGGASDDKAVTAVEYSTDGGKNWLPVDNLQTVGAQKVTFSFTPLTKTDGNYKIVVRVTDGGNNTALSEEQTMVIDRLPPVVGGMVTSLGPQIMQPDDQGTVRALMGTDQQITVNAVGGPTSIVVDAVNTTHKGSQSFSLTKSVDTGLWTGALAFHLPGTYTLTVRAVDGAGNKTERLLNTVVVDQPANVVDTQTNKPVAAAVYVYYRDQDTKAWVRWDGAAYGQTNPLKTKQGAYGAYLPAGTYYLKAEAVGYRSLMTKSITLDRPTILTSEMRLVRATGVKLGSWELRLPEFGLKQVPISAPKATAPSDSSTKIKAMPEFTLPRSSGGDLTTTSLFGKPTIMSFIATWAPPARDQMAILATMPHQDINVVAVSSGESKSQLVAYTKIAGYELPVATDTTNQLIAKFGASNLPTHYFIDRHGDVKKVVVGVLSKEEMLRYVSDGL